MKLSSKFIILSSLSLASCTDPSPSNPILSEKMIASLADQPVGSYTLIPNGDGKGNSDGRYSLLLKKSERVSEHSLNQNGQEGTLKISNFYKLYTHVNNAGNLEIEYAASGTRCGDDIHLDIGNAKQAAVALANIVENLDKIDGRPPACGNNWFLVKTTFSRQSFQLKPNIP